jgi:hypothetical protein
MAKMKMAKSIWRSETQWRKRKYRKQWRAENGASKRKRRRLKVWRINEGIGGSESNEISSAIMASIAVSFLEKWRGVIISAANGEMKWRGV